MPQAGGGSSSPLADAAPLAQTIIAATGAARPEAGDKAHSAAVICAAAVLRSPSRSHPTSSVIATVAAAKAADRPISSTVASRNTAERVVSQLCQYLTVATRLRSSKLCT